MTDPTRLTTLMHAVLDGEAGELEIRELESMLAADPAAQAEWEEWERLFHGLDRLPMEHAPEGLVAAVTARLPSATVNSDIARQRFPVHRVVEYTSTRAPASRFGASRASEPPTSPLRSLPMTQQSRRIFASRKGWLGAGVAAAAVLVIAQLAFDFPVAKDVMGTVAPAQRYRAAPNGSEAVQLAPAPAPGTSVGTTTEAGRTDADAAAQRMQAQSTLERNAGAQSKSAADLRPVAESKSSMDKMAVDKMAMDKASMDRAAMEKAAMEKAAMEKAAMERGTTAERNQMNRVPPQQ